MGIDGYCKQCLSCPASLLCVAAPEDVSFEIKYKGNEFCYDIKNGKLWSYAQHSKIIEEYRTNESLEEIIFEGREAVLRCPRLENLSRLGCGYGYRDGYRDGYRGDYDATE